MLLIVSFAAVLAQAAPAAAEGRAAQPAPAAAPPTAAPPIKGRVRKDGKICRAEPVLGSRMPVTLCATAEEWEARRQNDKESLDKIQHGVRNPNV